jgi:hypothetical protein
MQPTPHTMENGKVYLIKNTIPLSKNQSKPKQQRI